MIEVFAFPITIIGGVALICFLMWLQSYLFKRKTRPIYGKYTEHVEGEKIEREYVKYRQHKKSGLVYEFNWHSQGGDWDLCDRQKSDVILQKEREGKIK